MSHHQIAPPPTTFTYNREILNTILTAALNAQSYDSALARTVLNGREPWASWFRQLDAEATHVAQPSATVTFVSQRPGTRGRPRRFPTVQAFLDEAGPLIAKLRHKGEYPSQDAVGAMLCPHSEGAAPGRQIRKWLTQLGLSWDDVLTRCSL